MSLPRGGRSCGRANQGRARSGPSSLQRGSRRTVSHAPDKRDRDEPRSIGKCWGPRPASAGSSRSCSRGSRRGSLSLQASFQTSHDSRGSPGRGPQDVAGGRNRGGDAIGPRGQSPVLAIVKHQVVIAGLQGCQDAVGGDRRAEDVLNSAGSGLPFSLPRESDQVMSTRESSGTTMSRSSSSCPVIQLIGGTSETVCSRLRLCGQQLLERACRQRRQRADAFAIRHPPRCSTHSSQGSDVIQGFARR